MGLLGKGDWGGFSRAGGYRAGYWCVRGGQGTSEDDCSKCGTRISGKSMGGAVGSPKEVGKGGSLCLTCKKLLALILLPRKSY